MTLGKLSRFALNRFAEVIARLEFPDSPSSQDPPMLESQTFVLRAIAEQPGSVIRAMEPYRAGDKPLRARTVERLLATHELHIQRADDVGGTTFITLTAFGWDRITTVDKV